MSGFSKKKKKKKKKNITRDIIFIQSDALVLKNVPNEKPDLDPIWVFKSFENNNQ